MAFSQDLPIEGEMPKGGKNRIELKVASIPALLAMKGFALKGRLMSVGVGGKIAALIADCDRALVSLADSADRRWAWRVESH